MLVLTCWLIWTYSALFLSRKFWILQKVLDKTCCKEPVALGFSFLKLVQWDLALLWLPEILITQPSKCWSNIYFISVFNLLLLTWDFMNLAIKLYDWTLQGNLQVGREFGGSDSIRLKGPEIAADLKYLLNLLTLCWHFSKKPFPLFLEETGYSQGDVILQEPKAGVSFHS